MTLSSYASITSTPFKLKEKTHSLLNQAMEQDLICNFLIFLTLSIIVWKIRPDKPELEVTKEGIRDLVRRSIGPLIAVALILFLGYGDRLLGVSMTAEGYFHYYLLINVILVVLLVGWVVFQERRLKRRHQYS